MSAEDEIPWPASLNPDDLIPATPSPDGWTFPTVPDATPEDERPYTIGVQAFGLTLAQLNDLFDRIADAAHAKDEQLFCFGGYDLTIDAPTDGDKQQASATEQDLTSAVEAAARAWFDRQQAGRMDAGRFRDDGELWQWENLTPLDQHAYRSLVLPIVTATAKALADGARRDCP